MIRWLFIFLFFLVSAVSVAQIPSAVDTSLLKKDSVYSFITVRKSISGKRTFTIDSVSYRLNKKFMIISQVGKYSHLRNYYDTLGNIIRSSDSLFSAKGDFLSLIEKNWELRYDSDDNISEMIYRNHDGSVIEHFTARYRGNILREKTYHVRRSTELPGLHFYYDQKGRLTRISTSKSSYNFKYDKNGELEKVFAAGDVSQIPKDISYYDSYRKEIIPPGNVIEEKAFYGDKTLAEKITTVYEKGKIVSRKKEVLHYKLIYNSTGTKAMKTTMPLSSEIIYATKYTYGDKGLLNSFLRVDGKNMIVEKWKREYDEKGFIKKELFYNINDELFESVDYYFLY